MANANSSMKIWHALLLTLVVSLLSIIGTLGTASVSIQSKVAVNESRIESHDARFLQLDDRLRSIEAKIDRLIERK